MLRRISGFWRNNWLGAFAFLTIFLLLFSATASAQTYQIVNRQSGKVLDVTGGSSDEAFADQTPIQQWGWLGGLNQQWQLVPTDSGYYQIVNRQSGKVLDVIGGSSPEAYADNTLVQQYDWVGGGNQQWTFVPTDSGYSQIVNRQSGKVLDVLGGSEDRAKVDGAAIQQYQWVGGANQQWILIQVPTVQANNLTNPGLAPSFLVGDTFQYVITGPANQPVYLVQNSGPATQVGQTDGNGQFVTTGVEQTSEIGSYTQVWSVGDVPATPALTFFVGQLGGGGTVSYTDVGQTSDGSVVGVSVVSITNGTVSTYSATELDYTASLYYDAQTVGTLYEEGAPVAQFVSPVSGGTADGGLSRAATNWLDYDLQTDHYVVAYLFYGGYYQNPLYFSYGQCNEGAGDCTIGGYDGVFWIEAASIYLGSTLSDQTNVPQDGSLPYFDQGMYDNFLASSQPPFPTGVVFTANVRAWLSKLAAVGIISGVSLADPRSDISVHPIPFMVELLPPPAGDKYVQNRVMFSPDGERDRTYILKDSTGHAWANLPVAVRERFTDKIGPGDLPAANGCWYNNVFLNDCSNAAPLDQSRMTDHYGLSNLINPSEVGFIQYYYATAFTPPSLLGSSGFSLPGLSPNTVSVPLWIKDIYNSCEASRGGFMTLIPGQPVRLNRFYTGIDGDRGIGAGCAPPF